MLEIPRRGDWEYWEPVQLIKTRKIASNRDILTVLVKSNYCDIFRHISPATNRNGGVKLGEIWQCFVASPFVDPFVDASVCAHQNPLPTPSVFLDVPGKHGRKRTHASGSWFISWFISFFSNIEYLVQISKRFDLMILLSI